MQPPLLVHVVLLAAMNHHERDAVVISFACRALRNLANSGARQILILSKDDHRRTFFFHLA